MVIFTLGMLSTSVLMTKVSIKPKTLIVVGTVLELVASISVVCIDHYKTLVYVYTCLFSFGSAINHMTCLQILWEHYLLHRGEVAGFVFFCSWIGAYIMTKLCIIMINPDGQPSELVEGFSKPVNLPDENDSDP